MNNLTSQPILFMGVLSTVIVTDALLPYKGGRIAY